ncbi:MAG: DUF1232 domain-containing protein [Actinobacteria bacterium]|nr:DUF1232 domain-containing protein [Actinomycetota bacterium]
MSGGPSSDDAVRPDEVLTAEEAAERERSGERSVQGKPAWQELLRFLPDVARLLSRVAKDPRVPWHAKVVAGGAIAYVVSPVDLIPDVFGGLGQMDDIYIVTKALRYLFNTAGYDLIREHWSGSDDGFTLLLVVAGIER